jgi:hypothetical protein
MLAAMFVASTAVAQTEPPIPVPPEPSKPAEGTVSARFAVAGPVRPDARHLTLISATRNCGYRFDDPSWDAVAVAETPTTVGIRVDVRVMDDGSICRTEHQVRIPVELEAPLGERSIHDFGLDSPGLVPVNGVDPIDTGFRYDCDGTSVSIVDLVGPGLEPRPDRPRPRQDGVRLVADLDDSLMFLGPLSTKGAATEWWLYDGRLWSHWEGGACLPRVVLSPGIHAATWSLRGPRPGPTSRRLRVNVQGRECHGTPPVGQIARPIIQVRRDSIVIIMGTFFENQRTDSPYAARVGDGYDFIDCNGYGPVPMTIKLPVALGQRTLYDGGVYPPRVRGKKR